MGIVPTARGQAKAKRKPGAPDKRGQVMDAAVQLFLANGFDRTSVESIAVHAGVSKATVYAHFADKFALFRAVVERSGRSLAVQLDETRLSLPREPHERLTELVLIALEATVAPEFLAFLRVMVSESARHPELTLKADPSEPVDLIGLIASAMEDEADLHGYQLLAPRMFATLLLRMAVSSPQLDSLLFATFQPDHALLEAHARWTTTIFLRGIEPRPGESREVTPPPESYGYPWLAETPVRP